VGKYKDKRAGSLEDFPQNPYSLRLFCTKSVYVFKPAPTTGRTNAAGCHPSRVYSFFGSNLQLYTLRRSLLTISYVLLPMQRPPIHPTVPWHNLLTSRTLVIKSLHHSLIIHCSLCETRCKLGPGSFCWVRHQKRLTHPPHTNLASQYLLFKPLRCNSCRSFNLSVLTVVR
jgi:hypothetical protein